MITVPAPPGSCWRLPGGAEVVVLAFQPQRQLKDGEQHVRTVCYRGARPHRCGEHVLLHDDEFGSLLRCEVIA